MEIQTALLPCLPSLRNALIDVGLMYNLGNKLFPPVDQLRRRSGNLCTRDGICGAIFKEESNEGAAGVDEESDYRQVDYQEDCCSATHCEGRLRGVLLGGGGVGIWWKVVGRAQRLVGDGESLRGAFLRERVNCVQDLSRGGAEVEELCGVCVERR